MNVASSKDPRRQFLPGNVLCVALVKINVMSLCRDFMVGERKLGSSVRHILTCLVPTVIRLEPSQAILLMLLVHLLLANNVADPVREFILHMYRKPSLDEPKLARYWESGLKETHRTPNV